MSSIYAGSGSIYPDNKILQEQINPAAGERKEVKTARGESFPISSNTYVDLTRLGTLEVNGEIVYDGEVPNEIGDQAAKTDFVFNGIAEKLDSSSLAHKAVDLFQQDLGGGSLAAVSMEKGLTQEILGEDALISTHSVLAKKHFNALSTKGTDFQVVHEELIEVRPFKDPENPSYMKVKTLVKGKQRDLEARKADDMSISIAYTKEYTTMKEALKADYFGTKAGGLSNRQSYIKS